MAYITVADVRTAGLTAISVDDATVSLAITLWSEVIDRYCRQWFEPRPGDFMIDGTDSDTLHFSVPIISVDALYINNSEDSLNSSYYKVYNGNVGMNDDRRNPRIKLRGNSGYYNDIFTAPDGGTRFEKGRQNQRVVGSFGFVESDGSTPAAIKRALTRLVIQKVTSPLYEDPNNPSAPIALPPMSSANGQVTDEWTDWHRVKYAEINTPLPGRRDGMMEVIADPEIRGLLKLYRQPLAIATPANNSWRR